MTVLLCLLTREMKQLTVIHYSMFHIISRIIFLTGYDFFLTGYDVIFLIVKNRQTPFSKMSTVTPRQGLFLSNHFEKVDQ